MAHVSEQPLRIFAVAGSLNRQSVTKTVVEYAARLLAAHGCDVDVLDFVREPLQLFNPDTARTSPGFDRLQGRVEAADVLLLGTPDYHGSMSGVMKSFLDHFWHEFAGKLFVPMVASHEKGLTVLDQIRTVARQCYAWTLPYGISFADKQDVHEDRIVSETLRSRLEMLARDVSVYGELLASQRKADLEGGEPGFLARYRKSG